VVEGNMAVIREGLEATKKVVYDDQAFVRAEKKTARRTDRGVVLSASMSRADGVASASFLDREYFDDVVASHFRDGTIAEAPVLPGTGLFMPAGSAAWKDKGLFRRNFPEFVADLCIGCMDCALVCPDAAIPNSVHNIHDLLLNAIRQVELSEPQRESLRGQVSALSDAVREIYRRTKTATPFHQIVEDAAAGIAAGNALLQSNFGKLVGPDSLNPPDKRGGKADRGQVISCQPVVSGRDTPEVLQPVEGALDTPAQFIETLAEAERVVPVAAIGNDRLSPALVKFLAQFGAVVGFVAEHAVGWLHAADQTLRDRAIVRFASGQEDGEKAPFSICECMDLRVAPSARAANSLLLFPPFPPDAERCALMCVESIICVSVDRPCPASSRNKFSQMPRRAQRTNRL
jgi:ferredoxin